MKLYIFAKLTEIFPNMQELLKSSLWVQRTNHFKIKIRSKLTYFIDFLMIFGVFLLKTMNLYDRFGIFRVFSLLKRVFIFVS